VILVIKGNPFSLWKSLSGPAWGGTCGKAESQVP